MFMPRDTMPSRKDNTYRETLNESQPIRTRARNSVAVFVIVHDFFIDSTAVLNYFVHLHSSNFADRRLLRLRNLRKAIYMA